MINSQEKQAKEAKEACPLTEEAAALEPPVGSGLPRNLTFPQMDVGRICPENKLTVLEEV